MDQNNIKEEMISVYIGKNAEKILNKRINISAALFGVFYFIYRKAYMFAILLLLMVIYMPSLVILERFIYLFWGNKIYVWDAKRKISNILNDKSNLSETEILENIKTAGGTTCKGVLILLGIIMAIALIITLAFVYLSNKISPQIL